MVSRRLPDESPEAKEAHAQLVSSKAQLFIEAFNKACSSSNQTIYCHLLVAHVPDLIRRHGSLGKYCMQSLEAKHQIRKTRATNGKGPCWEVDKDGNRTLISRPNVVRVCQTLRHERLKILGSQQARQRLGRWERQKLRAAKQLEEAANELEQCEQDGDEAAIEAAANNAEATLLDALVMDAEADVEIAAEEAASADEADDAGACSCG